MSCVKGPPTEIEESNQNAFQTNNNKIQIGERRPVIESLFHVVPNLTSEVLLGEASLNALQAYELNAEDFIEVPENQNHPCLNRIVFHPGSMLKKCKSQVRRILGTRVQDNAGDEEGTHITCLTCVCHSYLLTLSSSSGYRSSGSGS
jgi:hypothetical protein